MSVHGQAHLTADLSNADIPINQPFNITYTLYGGVSQAFDRPSFAGFRLAGQSSTRGGRMKTITDDQFLIGNKSERSWTFTLMPATIGTFIINPAKVKVDELWIESPSIEVIVTPSFQDQSPDQFQANVPTKQRQDTILQQEIMPGQRVNQDLKPTVLNIEDIFIRATADKYSSWVGEPIMITYKIFAKGAIPSYVINKIPSFDGFWSENIALSAYNSQTSTEMIEEQPYYSALVRKVALFPKRPGKITVHPLDVEVMSMIHKQNQNINVNDLLDQIFNDSISSPGLSSLFPYISGSSSDFEYLHTTVKSNSITLNVQDLPTKNRTSDFSGQVGKYNIEAWLDKDSVYVDEVLTLFVKIAGDGNLSLLLPPEISFPGSFDIFDPQIQDQSRFDESGRSSYRVFSFRIVPRSPGTYTIPLTQLTYFEISVADYKTISTSELLVQVVGNGSGEMHQIAESDIRYIYLKSNSFRTINSYFFGSSLFYIVLILPCLLFVLFLVLLKRRMKIYADIQLLNSKKASKTAKKRLKKASYILKAGKIDEFYEETARALWDYITQRFLIQQAEMSVDNVISLLSDKEVNTEILNSLKSILDFCDFIRFAPGAYSSTPGDLLNKAEITISQLEQHIKQQSKSTIITVPKTVPHIIMLILFIIPVQSFAESFHDKSANDRFEHGNEHYKRYQFYDAIEDYRSILELGLESFETYYNLGNSYAKTNQLELAIYYYEKALQLKPFNDDAQFNLWLTNNTLLGSDEKIVTEPFYIGLIDRVMKIFSPDGWAAVIFILLTGFLLLLYMFILKVKQKFKQALLYASLVFLFFTVTSQYFGQRRLDSIRNPDAGIIVLTSVGVKSAPDISSADIYVVRAGMKVKILSSSSEWLEIRTSDGNKGWINQKSIKKL